MHFKIVGVDSLPPASSKFQRYVDAEIGRGRHSLRTEPVQAEYDQKLEFREEQVCSFCSLNTCLHTHILVLLQHTHTNTRTHALTHALTHAQILVHGCCRQCLPLTSDFLLQQLSCSVWDVNEVFRVQLLEKEDKGGHAKIKLLGEYTVSHLEMMRENADGSERRMALFTPEGERLTNASGMPTTVRVAVSISLCVLVNAGG